MALSPGITYLQELQLLANYGSGQFPFSGIKTIDLANGFLCGDPIKVGEEDVNICIKRFIGSRDPLPTSDDQFADIWGGTDISYPFVTDPLGIDLDISSENAGHTQQIRILGLDVDWNEQIVTVQLNGQNRVQVVAPKKWIRTCVMENMDATADIVGNNSDVWLYDRTEASVVSGKPQTSTKEKLVIMAGSATHPINTSQLGIGTIPSGFTGLIFNVDASVHKGTGGAGGAKVVDVSILVRDFGRVFVERDIYGINNNGTGLTQHVQRVPLIVPEKSDIAVRMNSNDLNTKGSVTYNVTLMPNELITISP